MISMYVISIPLADFVYMVIVLYYIVFEVLSINTQHIPGLQLRCCCARRQEYTKDGAVHCDAPSTVSCQ